MVIITPDKKRYALRMRKRNHLLSEIIKVRANPLFDLRLSGGPYHKGEKGRRQEELVHFYSVRLDLVLFGLVLLRSVRFILVEFISVQFSSNWFGSAWHSSAWLSGTLLREWDLFYL